MNEHKNLSNMFFCGLLISSIGSMTFTIGLIVFMAKFGYSLFQISLIIGLARLVPVLVSIFAGDLSGCLYSNPSTSRMMFASGCRTI